MPARVVCIGETMAVIAPAAAEPLAIAERFILGAGGAESNVAGHLASMGVGAAWLGRLGLDALGDRVADELRARGIDVRFIDRDPSAPTGLYVKDPRPDGRPAVQYYRARSAASMMSPADIPRWPVATADWVHVTGITPALSASCDALIEAVVARPGDRPYRVSFDVNYRDALWSSEVAAARCQELGDRCDLVLVGLDEAQLLWGVSSAEDVATLFPNAGRVVVKDGAVEAVEFDRTGGGLERVERVAALAVEIVEPVGAGDAFAAGYLGALIRGDGARERLAAGHELASWTLGSTADFRPRAATTAGAPA